MKKPTFMATATKFDAYERRTELDKVLLEQKLSHVIVPENTAQTRYYHNIINGKSTCSLAEHLDRELQEV